MRILVIVAVVLIVASCGKQGQLLNDLAEKEEIFRLDSAKGDISTDQIEELKAGYQSFISTYPESEHVPSLKFRSAFIDYLNHHRHGTLHAQIDTILQTYPSFSNREVCVGLKDSLTRLYERSLENIRNTESIIEGDSSETVDPSYFRAAAEAYQRFIIGWPNDERTPVYTYQLAIITYRNLRRPKEAVLHFEKLYEDHRGFEKFPETIFWLGYIYDNELVLMAKAENKYEEFLRLFPMHPFAKDTKFLLEYLGKSDNEILEGLLKKQMEEQKGS